jgi:hypothetical protein
VTWVKVCDTLHSHPKAVDAGLEAMGHWVLALSHCGAYLTDGHVKRAAAARLAGDRLDTVAGDLVRAGLWEPHPSGDGWQIHDYLKYNPSRAEVLAERDAKRAGGKRGAEARWARRTDGRSHGTSHGSSQGGSHASAIGIGDAPDPDPDPDPDPEDHPSGDRPAQRNHCRSSRRKPETSAPSSDAGQADVDSWCRKWAIPLPSIDEQAARFLDNARQNDRRCRDWSAAFRNWERNTPRFPRAPGLRRAGQQSLSPGEELPAYLRDGGV